MTNRDTQIVTKALPIKADAADAVMYKLIAAAGEDETTGRLVDLALEALPYKQDEVIAAQLLSSILLHDNLAEALNGRL
ncbi:hypothetical protein V6582_16875 [Agrobacterium vitis]|uniref:hypothetical protein n=1 Tax=Agrobacterium vitis TaxID=373 RepID=UPI0012E96F73|nr:hypothetical protein [Agrobacterium vitis]MVA17675.1 hypothetical protein [Agrobacterium vitis]MVA27850.1 hypothetical protein [Agrobacterium vitis]